jgi:hypothetical protein
LVWYFGKASRQIMTIMIVATSTGPGQRTTTVPMRRQPRVLILRLDSNNPNRLATVMMAGVRVSEAKITTSRPVEQGAPRVLKYGSRVKLRQYIAPDTVRPDARITWAVPPNMV